MSRGRGRGQRGATTRHDEVKESQQNNAYISTSSYAPSSPPSCHAVMNRSFRSFSLLLPFRPLLGAHFTQTRRELVTFYDANGKLHTKSRNY